MEINVRESDRIVEVWLTNEEKNNVKLREKLRPMYGEYKRKKYTVAVFESGNGELYNMTEGLILHNLKL